MSSITDLASNNHDISTTRWALCSIVRLYIIASSVLIIASLVGHFIGKPIPKEAIEGSIFLIGTITTVIGGSKIMQGFEKNEKWKEL